MFSDLLFCVTHYYQRSWILSRLLLRLAVWCTLLAMFYWIILSLTIINDLSRPSYDLSKVNYSKTGIKSKKRWQKVTPADKWPGVTLHTRCHLSYQIPESKIILKAKRILCKSNPRQHLSVPWVLKCFLCLWSQIFIVKGLRCYRNRGGEK